MEKTIGQIAFEAWQRAMAPEQTLSWEKRYPHVREAWEASALATVAYVKHMDTLHNLVKKEAV